MQCAKLWGYCHVTRQQIALEAGVSTGLVSHYLGDMDELKKSLIKEAIRVDDRDVLAQGLALKDPVALDAPFEQKQKAIHELLKKEI